MKKGIKSKKGIVITIILIAVLIVGAVAGYFIYRNYSWKKSYDVETGMIVKNRVAKAQYLPNLNLLVGRSHSSINSASNSAGESYCMTDLAFTLNDYKKIERELAAITGSSTRLDTSIEEIKKEIYTVLDLVPVFDKWFRLPHFSDEENGYYSNYYYKLSYDRSTQRIHIIRMTLSVVCTLYNSSEDKIYSSYYDDNMDQYQIMEANYYYNEDNKEVVECSVVDFARFKNNFYPIQCQYLANVQDTSTTKIQVVIRKEIDVYEDKLESNPGQNISEGLDMDTSREGGVMRKILQLNYGDSNNVELIKIEQNFGTNYLSDITTTSLAYYLKESENVIYFVDSWDYYDAEHSHDTIKLNNLFRLRTSTSRVYYGSNEYTEEHYIAESRRSIVESFINSEFVARQVMSTPGDGRSSRNVCSDCYRRSHDSGLMVYKCDHNKSKDTITRAERMLISTSENYKNEKYDLITWHIGRHLSKFANNLGVPDQIIEKSTQVCKKLNDDEYAFESKLDLFLTSLAKDYLENVSLAKDVKNLYKTIKREAKQLKVDNLNKSAVSSELTLDNLNETTSISNNILTVSATATVKAGILLEKNAEYSLGLVLYDNDSHVNCTLLTNYEVYSGDDLSLTLNGTYDISDFMLEKRYAGADKSINLTLGFVLLKKGNPYDIVCSNYELASVTDGDFSDFDNVVNGFGCFYQAKIVDNTFQLTVSCKDIEGPTITLVSSNDQNVTLNSGSNIFDLILLLNITDNDGVASIQVFHDNKMYGNWDDTLVAGMHAVIIADRSGNHTIKSFNVTLA